MNKAVCTVAFLFGILVSGLLFAQSPASSLAELTDRIERIEAVLGPDAATALESSSDRPLVSVSDSESRSVPQAMFTADGRLDTRKAILEAASKELRPLQVARLRLAMALRPVKTQAAIDMVEMRLQAEGMMTEDSEIAAAVDWSQIFAIFLELLPTILKFFGL